MKNNDLTIGKLLDENQKRDAIHFALAPVVAGEGLRPGQRIGFLRDGSGQVGDSMGVFPIGIVDPFLNKNVMKGDRFWLFLYPKTVTSLRHVWTHPEFCEEDDWDVEEHAVLKAKRRIREIAIEIEVDYHDLMNGASTWLEKKEAIVQVDSDSWKVEFRKHAAEFWENYEIVTKKKVDDQKANIFICVC